MQIFNLAIGKMSDQIAYWKPGTNEL